MPAAAAAHIAFALALSNDFFARSGGLFLGAAAAATTGARSRSLCRHPRRQPPQARASEILEQRSSTESERIKKDVDAVFKKVPKKCKCVFCIFKIRSLRIGQNQIFFSVL